MHIGGGLAKVVVRAEVPSALGHGVSPVMVAPGGGTVIAGTLGVGAVVAVLVWLLSLPPVKRESTNRMAMMPTTRPIAQNTERFRFWRCCSASAASMRAWRPCF